MGKIEDIERQVQALSSDDLTHHASPDFWACYRSLPQEIQKLADAAYARLKQDPRHPSLHFSVHLPAPLQEMYG